MCQLLNQLRRTSFGPKGSSRPVAKALLQHTWHRYLAFMPSLNMLMSFQHFIAASKFATFLLGLFFVHKRMQPVSNCHNLTFSYVQLTAVPSPQPRTPRTLANLQLEGSAGTVHLHCGEMIKSTTSSKLFLEPLRGQAANLWRGQQLSSAL